MPSVRQKKGIRAVSSPVRGTSPTASSLPRPVVAPNAPSPTGPVSVRSKEPAKSSATYSARNKTGKQAHAAVSSSSTRGSSSSTSPTYSLSSTAPGTRPVTGKYTGVYGRTAVVRGLEKSLRETVRQAFLSDVIRMDGGTHRSGRREEAWRVMILDERATRVISSVVGMYDIMEGHVTVVEDLHKVRQPFPEMEGVYVVSPTSKSVEAIKKDFKSDSESLYRAVHLFFLKTVPRELMSSLKQCSALLARLKTFKEINMDFLVPEMQTYHLDMGSLSGSGEVDPATHFRNLYGGRGQSEALSSIAQRLVTLCATLGEFPHIRFAADGGGRTEVIARTFQASMEAFVGNSPSWNFRGQDSRVSDGGRATLLLLDRADDPLSPLMHDFTYQCLVQDLLDVQDDRVTYTSETSKGEVKKEAILGDSDTLWTEFRHQHIAKVLSDLGNRFRDLVASNAGAAALVKGNGRQMSVEDMARATRDLPEFQELSKKMAQHVRMSQECMSKLERIKLLQAGALEQTMALGKDELGSSKSRREILDGWIIQGNEYQPGLLQLLKSSRTPEEMKVRLVAIWSMTQAKATEEESKLVTSTAHMSAGSAHALGGLDTLVASSGLGGKGGDKGSAAVDATGKKRTNFFNSFGFGSSKQEQEEAHEYTHMRYNPPLKALLSKIIAGELSMEEYPPLLPMPGQSPTRKAVGRSIRKGGGGASGGGQDHTAFTGARVIVFVIGGVAYSETRAAYEAMNAYGREVIIGGTTLLPPSGYLEGLKGLA